MKKLCALLSAALLAAAVPALAGGEKCTLGAQGCLDYWSSHRDMGWIGVEYDKSQEGVLKVKAVAPDSPGAAGGFEAGDVVVAVNGAPTTDREAMTKAKGEWKAGQPVTYTVQRQGVEKQIAVTLGRMPDVVYYAMVGSHMLQNHVTAATTAAETGANAAPKEEKK